MIFYFSLYHRIKNKFIGDGFSGDKKKSKFTYTINYSLYF